MIAGWSSLVARQAHNLKVAGSNPAPATNLKGSRALCLGAFQHFVDGVRELNHGVSSWFTNRPWGRPISTFREEKRPKGEGRGRPE